MFPLYNVSNDRSMPQWNVLAELEFKSLGNIMTAHLYASKLPNPQRCKSAYRIQFLRLSDFRVSYLDNASSPLLPSSLPWLLCSALDVLAVGLDASSWGNMLQIHVTPP